MLRSIVESQNSPSVFAVSPSDAKAYCDVPLKQQTKSYNCGFATMLQTLYGMGKQSAVSGNSDSAKMNQLEAESDNYCRIADCNYKNEYYGYHNVTIQDAYETVSEEKGRYLIYN